MGMRFRDWASNKYPEYAEQKQQEWEEEYAYKAMKLVANESNIEISEGLAYHIKYSIPLEECIFRYESKAYYDLINEVRELYNNGLIILHPDDQFYIDIGLGLEATHQGKKVKLNSPIRSERSGKKYKVYVKDGDRVKVVHFGDPKLSVKNHDPKARKSFMARHKCSEKKDKTKAGYWACRVGRFSKQLGLKSSKPW